MALHRDESPAWFAVVLSDLHPPTTFVELPEPEAVAAVGDDAVCTARYDERRQVAGLATSASHAPEAPPLWFAELTEPDAAPPASTLLAFTGHGVEPGSLLDRTALAGTDVRSDDQLGAIRWYPATGEADQVYVAPAWRRRKVASALAVASGTLNLGRGLPRMWGDGQRTSLGEKWVQASVFRDRVAPQTHLAPPMTPFDER